jgi:hypothetical protein
VVRPRTGEGAEQVLVLVAAQAPRRRGALGGRRPRAAKDGEVHTEVPVTRATVIEAAPLASAAEAGAWLERAARAEAEATVAAAAAVLRRAVHAHRLAAADPYAAPVDPARALVTRIGYGSGEEVADGHWTEARELPLPRIGRASGRQAGLRPHERLAALLGGRDAPLACEELALRARLDLDEGREREAAMQVHLALEAARVELTAYAGLGGVTERTAALDGLRDATAQAANAALQGGLGAGARTAVEEALRAVEAALRARSVSGPY